MRLHTLHLGDHFRNWMQCFYDPLSHSKAIPCCTQYSALTGNNNLVEMSNPRRLAPFLSLEGGSFVAVYGRQGMLSYKQTGNTCWWASEVVLEKEEEWNTPFIHSQYSIGPCWHPVYRFISGTILFIGGCKEVAGVCLEARYSKGCAWQQGGVLSSSKQGKDKWWWHGEVALEWRLRGVPWATLLYEGIGRSVVKSCLRSFNVVDFKCSDSVW